MGRRCRRGLRRLRLSCFRQSIHLLIRLHRCSRVGILRVWRVSPHRPLWAVQLSGVYIHHLSACLLVALSEVVTRAPDRLITLLPCSISCCCASLPAVASCVR